MITKPENPPTMTLRRRLKRGRRWLVAMLARGFISGVSLLPFGFTRFALPRLLRTFAFLLRKQAMTQLELAYGDAMEPRERRRVSNRVAWNLGLFLAELLASWRGKIPAGYVEAGDTRERVRELLDEGKGLIGITGHVGNWELLGTVFRESAGEQAGPAIAKRHPNPWLNDFIVESRARIGWEIVFQDAGLRPLLRALKSGKMLGTVPDQDIRRAAGIFVPFFGRDAYTSTGPASLSVFSGAPILLGFLRRRPGGLVLDLYEPIRPDMDAPDREAEIERLTRAWSDVVETQIRKQPEDWMWFHERWKTTPERLVARKAARQSEGH
jgi:KDO2-lipid IV(A) lauroyltransferase